MNKRDVSKALAQGSARQRALIFAEDTAQYQLTQKGFLTEAESRALRDSFKTPAEIRLYNKFLKCDRTFIHVFPYLKQMQLAYEISIAYLSGYCLLWYNIQQQEDTYNRILIGIKDKATKKEIIKTLTKTISSSPMLARIKEDKEEGLVRIETGEGEKTTRDGYDLVDLIKVYSERATEQLKEAKAMAQALYDFMAEEGFTVKTYQNSVDELWKALSTDKAVTPKFSKQTTGLFFDEVAEIMTPENRAIQEKLLSKYWVFPDPQLRPDPERVEWYKNKHIYQKDQ